MQVQLVIPAKADIQYAAAPRFLSQAPLQYWIIRFRG